MHATLHAEWVFSEEEFSRIRDGVIPTSMEKKWFIYFEDDHLNFHRSWTGICIYRMGLKKTPEGYKVTEILVNHDPEEYLAYDDEIELKILKTLINMLLEKML